MHTCETPTTGEKNEYYTLVINSIMEMNSSRRSRGFKIARLLPFWKALKPPTASQDLYNNVHYTSSTTTSYAPQPDFSNYVTPLPPKVSFLLQPCT